jgi:diguanylate cyclase (GGDEF)-like protein
VAGYLTLPYAAALTASSMAALLFLLVALLARKINDLERALRDMSADRRADRTAQSQGFLPARRTSAERVRARAGPLTLLFFNADGLKKINDTLGHDVGSERLRDIATLLRTTFRSSDIVGRLGGDEFAVITRGRPAELTPALRRLDNATEAANGAGDKPYRISVSRGGAATDPRSDESFADLVERADAAMYQDKRQRRASREAGGAAQSWAS